MEALAKVVHQTQSAVQNVQEEAEVLRCFAEDDEAVLVERTPNPYYVDLQLSLKQRQEAATELLERSAALVMDHFYQLEVKAAQLGNVADREAELRKTKRSMSRYFESHNRAMAVQKEDYEDLLRLERAKRLELEDQAASGWRIQGERQALRRVMMTWMKRAIIRSLTRDYTARRTAVTQTYQAAALHAVLAQRDRLLMQRVFHSWKLRRLSHQMLQWQREAVEAREEVHELRAELTSTQQLLEAQQRLVQHRSMVAQSDSVSKANGFLDEEVRRLKAAMKDVTVEFSERTQTYVCQQAELEQLFLRREERLKETVVQLQSSLEQQTLLHLRTITDCGALHCRVVDYFKAAADVANEAVERKESVAFAAAAQLTNRLRERALMWQKKSESLTQDVELLAPLSMKCVALQNEVAGADQLIQKAKGCGREWERQSRSNRLVSVMLNDCLKCSGTSLLRWQYFARWMGCSLSRRAQLLQNKVYQLNAKGSADQQQHRLQQHREASHHREEVAQAEAAIHDLTLEQMKLKSQMATAMQQLEERDRLHFASEVERNDLATSLLREKFESRAFQEKWIAARYEALLCEEAQHRTEVARSEMNYRSVIIAHELAGVKVWAASLHSDVQQLTQLCQGWQQHCSDADMKHIKQWKSRRMQLAEVLHRTAVSQRLQLLFMGWIEATRRRRATSQALHQTKRERLALQEEHTTELRQESQRFDAEMKRQQISLVDERNRLQQAHQQKLELMCFQHEAQLREKEEIHTQVTGQLRTCICDLEFRHEQEVEEMESHVAALGETVVTYCAQATYTRWRLWVLERRRAANTAQQQDLLHRVELWMRQRHSLEGTWLFSISSAFSASTVAAVQSSAAQEARCMEGLRRENELMQLQRQKVAAAKENVEAEMRYLQEELSHARTLFESERAYSDLLQRAIAEEKGMRRASHLFAHRFHDEWIPATYRLENNYGAALLDLYTSSVSALMHKQTEMALTALLDAAAAAVVPLTAYEVSDPVIAAPTPIVVTLLNDGAARRLASIAAATLRLQRLDGGTESSYVDEVATLHEQLATPFTTATTAADDRCLVSSGPLEVSIPEVDGVVLQLLEVTRLAAVQFCSAEAVQHAHYTQQLEDNHARVKEELHSMTKHVEALVAEQRNRQVEREDQADLQRRLDALVDHYTNVLEVFYRDITSRQSTFYSVNKMLEEIDGFSAALLERFEANMTALTAIQQQWLATQQASSSPLLSELDMTPCVGRLSTPPPMDCDVSVSPPSMTPDRDPAMVLTLLHHTASGPEQSTARNPNNALSHDQAPIRSFSASSERKETTPERVRLLEQQLVETKVQLAETMALLDSRVTSSSSNDAGTGSGGGAGAHGPSLQAEVWAQEDVETLPELSLNKEQLLCLYGAAEDEVRALMSTLHDMKGQLVDLKEQMPRQLHIACVSVEESVKQRHRTDMECYEVKLQSLTLMLQKSMKEREVEREEYEKQLALETASAAQATEEWERRLGQTRHRFQAEIDDLVEHQQSLQLELKDVTDSMRSTVEAAVARATELLEIEHAQRLRLVERVKERLEQERDRLEEAAVRAEACHLLQLKQEQEAVRRLQHQLSMSDVEQTSASSPGCKCIRSAGGCSWAIQLSEAWAIYARDTTSLFSDAVDCKVAWMVFVAAGLMEAEWEQYETEVVKMKEWIVSIGGPSQAATEPFSMKPSIDSTAAAAAATGSQLEESPSTQSSTLDLSISPLPHYSSEQSKGRSGLCSAPRSSSRMPFRASANAPAPQMPSMVSPSVTPHRCRSPRSMDSLDLSQSMLRYSAMLSNQRARNSECLENATALTKEFDELLSCGAQLGKRALHP